MMADVGCAGILVADTFCGPLLRLPNEGELMAIDDMPSKAGGCAANVAIDLARQGVSVDVAGCVGKDSSAEVLLGALVDAGVSCKQVTRTEKYGTSKTIILLVERQDRRYLHLFGANRAFTIGQIDRAWVEKLKVFYLGGLFAMPGLDVGELAELFAFCRSRKIVTVLDVVVPQTVSGMKELEQLLPNVDYFVPNDDEAERLTGHSDSFDQLNRLLSAGTGTVIITRGTAGSIAARGTNFWEAGAYRMQAVDPSGSGDAFTSGVIVGILQKWDMPKTLQYASGVGGSATLAVGTTDRVFTAAQAEAFIAANPMQMMMGSLAS